MTSRRQVMSQYDVMTSLGIFITQAYIPKMLTPFAMYSPGSISGALFLQQLPQSVIEYPIKHWRQLWENNMLPEINPGLYTHTATSSPYILSLLARAH